FARRLLADDVDRAPERVLDERLAPGPTAEPAVELELEPGKPGVVETGESEHLRAHAALGVAAALLRIEAQARDLAALEQRRACRIGLPRDVDEPVRAVGERRVELRRVDAECLPDEERRRPRVADLARVGVDRGRLLADR